MTPRSFWAILIKILGIYIILDSLTGIPAFVATIISFRSTIQVMGSVEIVIFEFCYYIVVIFAYGFICWLSLFKTDKLIDKLKLDKGFQDERFEFSIHRSDILKITIMVIGGLILINSFPYLCKSVFAYFEQASDTNRFKDSKEAPYMIIYFLQALIGYFLLTCSRMVVNYIELKRQLPTNDVVSED